MSGNSESLGTTLIASQVDAKSLNVISPNLGPSSILPIEKAIAPLELDRKRPAAGFSLIVDCDLRSESEHASSSVAESELDSAASIDQTTHIIDFLIGEIDDKLIAPPMPKKQRTLSTA